MPKKSKCARNTSGVMSFSMEPPVRKRVEVEGKQRNGGERIGWRREDLQPEGFSVVILNVDLLRCNILSYILYVELETQVLQSHE